MDDVHRTVLRNPSALPMQQYTRGRLRTSEIYNLVHFLTFVIPDVFKSACHLRCATSSPAYRTYCDRHYQERWNITGTFMAVGKIWFILWRLLFIFLICVTDGAYPCGRLMHDWRIIRTQWLISPCTEPVKCVLQRDGELLGYWGKSKVKYSRQIL